MISDQKRSGPDLFWPLIISTVIIISIETFFWSLIMSIRIICRQNPDRYLPTILDTAYTVMEYVVHDNAKRMLDGC